MSDLNISLHAAGKVTPVGKFENGKPTGEQDTDKATGLLKWQVKASPLVDGEIVQGTVNVKLLSDTEPTVTPFQELPATLGLWAGKDGVVRLTAKMVWEG